MECSRDVMGRYMKVVSDSQIVEYIRDRKGILTTKEIAAKFNMVPQHMHKRLKTLWNEGWIRGKKAGHTMLWWVGSI